MYRGIVIFLLLTLFFSCKNHWYRVSNKKNHITNGNYDRNDTLLLKDYIVCNNLRGVWGNESVLINQDSILEIFVSSLEKLDLVVANRGGKGVCDTSFFSNPNLKYKNLNYDFISEIGLSEESEIVLVPVIYLDNTFLKSTYFTSTGIRGGGGYNKSTALRIGIFLFKESNVIYFKSMHFFSDGVHVSDRSHPIRNVNQEHWDKLVELIMWDYMR